MWIRSFHRLLLACTVGIALMACDQSAQNVEYQEGEGISVDGPSTLVVPNYDSTGTAAYIVKAFTVDKDYSWSVEGATLQGTIRDGEVAIASTSDTSATYTVTATTTVDGQEMSGSASGAATYPSPSDQLSKYNNLSTFQATAGGAGVTDFLEGRDTTGFIPTDAAFLSALDDDDSDDIGDAELPPNGVLVDIFKYHVVTSASIRSGDISGGQTEPTLLGEDVSFSVSSGDVTVNATGSNAAVLGPDIATDGATLHRIDNLLLPNTVVSINDHTVIRDNSNNVDSVAVAGTYVSDTDGSFIVIHDEETGNIIGSSDELANGFHGSQAAPVKVELNNQLTQDTTVVAMPHRDGNNNGSFDGAGLDPAYTRGGSAVTDTASVSLP